LERAVRDNLLPSDRGALAAARAALAGQVFDAVLLDHDLDDGKGAELILLFAKGGIRTARS
jgi:hypothetical protein